MKVKGILLITLLIVLSIVFFNTQNNLIQVSELELELEGLPDAFNGFKIVQISDLHSKNFGSNQENLVREITKVQPDLIVVTGDLVDSKHYNEANGLMLLKQSKEIAPVYYVTGNHEWWSGRFNGLERHLNEIGIKVLRDERIELEREKDIILLLGIDDPAAYSEDIKAMDTKLGTMLETVKKDDFTILLSHRPEYFTLYSKHNIDLTYSGHAHGGQVRLPVMGGLIAPGQGVFPKFTSGYYTAKDSIMIVSRGLGNSIIPQRLFNRPEVVVTVLKNRDQ